MCSETIEQRFWSKVVKTDACWLWAGGTSRHGYGKFWIDGALRGAHRVSLELTHGYSILPATQVRHRCRNKACVRPDHLELGTAKDNAADHTATGLRLCGPVSPVATLTEGDVRLIQSGLEAGLSTRAAAHWYATSKSTVHRIMQGKLWPRYAVPGTAHVQCSRKS